MVGFRGVATLAALLVACGGQSAADHEKLGDRAYSHRGFAAALVEYRLEIVQDTDNERLRFKAGAAALAAGDLLAAAEEFSALVALDPENSDAIEGLDRVASEALSEGNREALNIALTSLQERGGRRALGRYATALAAGFGPGTPVEQALQVLPVAAAVATDSRQRDSLVFEYAGALVRAGNCTAAVSVYEGLVRRQGVDAESSRSQLARCALLAGRRELRSGRPTEAVRWFERAIVGGGESYFALSAYLGLGDALFSQGDFLGASEAFLGILDRANPGDSIYQVAVQRLNDIGAAPEGDDGKEEF